jgi:threonine dehydratase
VPPRDMPAFATFLKKLGYQYVDESRNPAYRLFLG